MTETVKVAYGSDPSQFAELHLPTMRVVGGVVVIIHGGYWKSNYGYELGTPLAVDFAARGIPAWNLEYRRRGNGGGWPETLEDVAAGIDRLAAIAEEYALNTSRLVALGHSAGGHLAVWAAGRDTLPSGAPGAAVDSPSYLPLTAVVSQSGVLDLGAAARLHLDHDAVHNLLGFNQSENPETFAQTDPIQQLPLTVPVYAVHTTEDNTVPVSQSSDYVSRAVALGAPSELHLTPGDHFVLIDVQHPAYHLCRSLVERALN